jgi:Domain of unknown function (DUF6794)
VHPLRVHTRFRLLTPTPSDARSRCPSLILFSLGLMLRLILLSIIFLTACQSERQAPLTLAARERLGWPTSLDESRAYLVNTFDERDNLRLCAIPETQLRQREAHLIFYIRKRFGLDQGNTPLLRATGTNDPDKAALVILTDYRRVTKGIIEDHANR